MLWAPYLFIVFYAPKVLKLLAVGVFGGVFLGCILSLVSLIAAWMWPGTTYIFSAVVLSGWGLTG